MTGKFKTPETMKKFRKIVLMVLIVLIASGAVFALVVQNLADRTFDIPEPSLQASEDPQLIARGRYLAFGPAHCASCHAPGPKVQAAMHASTLEEYRSIVGSLDSTTPLSGGFTYSLELGKLHFPNITPDTETGIGRYTDGQLARLLRHGVKPNGQAIFPVMEYQNISDEDVIALLSFMRSQTPVRNAVPDHELTFMGKAVKAFLFRPMGPDAPPPVKSSPEQATVERGEYLANRVAQCAQCHTRRNMTDLSFNGPRFAGGAEINESWAPDIIFVPPNLTPDPKTGHIVNWSEDQFVERFRAGTLIQGTPMDWELFARMSDTDLRAIYRYLMRLDPVENETGPTVKMAQ